jgi:hypothetical protein
MSQDKVEYLWEFITEAEYFYTYSTSNFDQNVDSTFYEQFKRIADYLYGFDTDSYDSGLIFGLKVVPHSQIIKTTENLDDLKVNYNVKNRNIENSSVLSGFPMVSSGMVYFNCKTFDTNAGISITYPVYIIDNSDADLVHPDVKLFFIYPPDNLKNAIATSTLVFDTSSKKILNLFKKGDSGYFTLTTDCLQFITNKTDMTLYYNKFYDSNYFRQPDSSYIDLARIVWRIEDTTDNNRNNHKFEYYVIDNRDLFGYYGLKQTDILDTIHAIINNIEFTDYDNMVIQLETLFSFIFNDMSWDPNFKDYWEGQGKTLSPTLLDLYNRLAE